MQKQIADFGDLVALLRDWRCWSSDEVYDFGGMMVLLGACLDNLRKFALQAELEEASGFLRPEQMKFLAALTTSAEPQGGADSASSRWPVG